MELDGVRLVATDWQTFTVPHRPVDLNGQQAPYPNPQISVIAATQRDLKVIARTSDGNGGFIDLSSKTWGWDWDNAVCRWIAADPPEPSCTSPWRSPAAFNTQGVEGM